MPGGDYEFAKAFQRWAKGDRVFGHTLPIPILTGLIRSGTLTPVSYADQKKWKPKTAMKQAATVTAAETPAPEERLPSRGPGRPRKTDKETSVEDKK